MRHPAMLDWQRIVRTNIRWLHKMRCFSQRELAFDCRIRLTYLNRIGSYKRNPNLAVLVRIAEALSIFPADLLKPR
jgi:transcriptional regulator with XRE-family HTH domain